jgi:hypothetical protein
MVHVTIEYMIMIPLLILQIFLFPLTASWLMTTWIDSRRNLALQDVAGHLASAIQQLYFSLNHATMLAGRITYAAGLPPFIEDLPFAADATLRPTTAPSVNSSNVIDLTVRLVGTRNMVKTEIVLGPDIDWRQSTFVSNSTKAAVTAQKFANNQTIALWFAS